MRLIRVGITILAGAATTAIAASAAIALSTSDAPSDNGQPGDVLVTGSTVSGEPYTIARMSDATRSLLGDAGTTESPSGDVCLEVKAHGYGTAGCIPPPGGKKLHPTYTTLGEDMIIYVLAGADVERLEVRRTDGQGDVTSSGRSTDLGDVRLVHTVLHVPASTLPSVGETPVSPGIEVKALDSAGEVVDKQTLGTAHTNPS